MMPPGMGMPPMGMPMPSPEEGMGIKKPSKKRPGQKNKKSGVPRGKTKAAIEKQIQTQRRKVETAQAKIKQLQKQKKSATSKPPSKTAKGRAARKSKAK